MLCNQIVTFLVCLTGCTLFMFSYTESYLKKKNPQEPTFITMIRDKSICNVNAMLDAVTGSLFEMNVKRRYTREVIDTTSLRKEKRVAEGMKCDQWVVITSVNNPTVVVKQIAESKEQLCIVIVADKKTPVEYTVDRSHLVYLSVEDQKKMNYHIVDMIPFNNFARKNIGFLYAMEHGAKQIFDIDDDNELISAKDIYKQVYDKSEKAFQLIKTDQYVTNPYMIYMNKPTEYIWPRGYPLEAIKMPHNYTFIKQANDASSMPYTNIGVIQYLQDVNPDLDAIYRITTTIPPTFDPSIKHCVILSQSSFSPFNAQSTLFEYNTFWGMLLPMTVHGRVSDIWRSYFTQKVMWERGIYMSFCPSIVNHIRNQHRLIKDFDAELPLYTQAESLAKYLRDWKPQRKDIPGMLEDMYIDMYERGILEEKDVHFMQAWIKDLYQVGYVFN